MAKVPRLELPDVSEIEQTHTAANIRQIEMGFLGKFFGSRDQAPVYIAGLIILVGLVAICAIAFFPLDDPSLRPDLLKFLSGLILSALGYMFGSLTGRS